MNTLYEVNGQVTSDSTQHCYSVTRCTDTNKVAVIPESFKKNKAALYEKDTESEPHKVHRGPFRRKTDTTCKATAERNKRRSNSYRSYSASPRFNHGEQTVSLSCYKQEKRDIARQLGYRPEILDLIDSATSERGVDRAMVTGRQQMMDR